MSCMCILILKPIVERQGKETCEYWKIDAAQEENWMENKEKRNRRLRRSEISNAFLPT